MTTQSDTQSFSEELGGIVLRDLYERHDAFKGWWEPVYGKRYHIGDTCTHCGTHFRGLEDDIKLLVKTALQSRLEALITQVENLEYHGPAREEGAFRLSELRKRIS